MPTRSSTRHDSLTYSAMPMIYPAIRQNAPTHPLQPPALMFLSHAAPLVSGGPGTGDHLRKERISMSPLMAISTIVTGGPPATALYSTTRHISFPNLRLMPSESGSSRHANAPLVCATHRCLMKPLINVKIRTKLLMGKSRRRQWIASTTRG